MPTRRYNFFPACMAAIAMTMLSLCAHAADYQLGASDLLHINVFDHPELALDVRVSQSGNISYPLIGEVHVDGLSTHQAEELLATKLHEGGFIKQPQVSILVGDFQSQKVSVIGQVGKPGQYPLIGSQKVLDVLALASGILPDSAADQATLISANGNVQIIDLQKLSDGDLRMNLEIHSGDTLSVARAAQFYIYGEVQHPGVYRLGRDMTVSQAIATGGGLTKHGTERGAKLKRRDSHGVERVYHPKSSDVLRPDDVLLIKESLF
ncbi:MAG: polysaccharide export protein EpsE [Steroidobacter sp.]